MKRFIEESFPVKEVSAESAREKNIRHGHISTLHIWWARRPLASSRTTAYAALIPPPKDAEEWNAKRNFISDLSKWENSLSPHLIETARKEILEANGGVPPQSTRSLWRRRSHSAGSAAPRLRNLLQRSQPRGCVDSEMHARIPAEVRQVADSDERRAERRDTKPTCL